MRAYEILEYQTRSGEEIDFKYKEDVEGDNNRGWMVDQIDAYVKGDYAGYITISYIPKERFIKYYPTILNYMSMIGGSHPLPLDKKDAHYKDLNDDELKRTIQRVSHRSRKYHDYWNDENNIPENRAEMLNILEDIIKNELKDDKRKFEEFIDYHIDKPLVDFIRVFNKGDSRDTRRSLKKGEKTEITKQDYKRQQIGTSLYLEAAKWMKEKGLRLYASGTQTDSAQAAWEKFEKEGRVATDGKRRYLKV